VAAPALAIAARGAARAALLAEAVGTAARRAVAAEWNGTGFHAWRLSRPRTQGFAAAPKDPRPADPAVGAEILAGRFILGGDILRLTPGEDPWNRPSPSRRFAARLHRFDWLRDLAGAGEPGLREGLRLTLEWRRVFGRWNSFAWRADVLERRVVNLACAGRGMASLASDAEASVLADLVARQARQLLVLTGDDGRRAEQLTAGGVAGAALAGFAGEDLMRQALERLAPVLEFTVLADGGHASRSPQAGLALLFDLLTLDEGLSQRGVAPPEGLSRAIDRLTAALSFFTLADGRLACFQGGEASTPGWVAAGGSHNTVTDPPATPPLREAPHAGYQRLDGPGLQVIADAGAPASGAFSLAACGQPLAIEVVCGRDRLITNCGWSAEADGPQALRLAPGGSTASIGEGSAGAPMTGFLARAFGYRLDGGASKVVVNRRDAEAGVWVEMHHDGWLDRYGLTHERRLFLDRTKRELRGEDRFVPASNATDRTTPVDIRFHLHPDARASLARDQRSVLLRGASNIGWWLRNDAAEVSIEPSVHFIDGRARLTSQVVLRGRLRADRGGRVRWKLALVEPAPP
jgi:uncharacterized heparinase superfamily protein